MSRNVAVFIVVRLNKEVLCGNNHLDFDADMLGLIPFVATCFAGLFRS